MLLLGYLLLVCWLALRPLTLLWVSPANLEPLATLRADLARGPVEAGRTVVAGLVRLAPLGVLLPLLGARLGGGRLLSLSHTVFLGATLSLGLEAAQTLAPSRVSDIDSVLLNTLGVALAHQVAYGPLRRYALVSPRGWAADAPPDPAPAPAPTADQRRGRRPTPGREQALGGPRHQPRDGVRAPEPGRGPGAGPGSGTGPGPQTVSRAGGGHPAAPPPCPGHRAVERRPTVHRWPART
ncbi:VanZ family protein [Streptomyces sp. DSM 44915]|uniref:VanZ family protein n=1 Tax=Streptomyces chisholmiae TaxID=3075540 RepID=A0ABU2JK01_9ACTN|nr:VanZ family protein [Streptomyces sp. DSM 44915]MDT0265307.1 VanZ family protein [Streptomyces sp. DSM 44915]